ncbi:MAG: DNA repair protein RadC [Bacteroidetes bacterium]|nr:MAG: DNA repair protein RadC [Bacteroidota bacterium]
MTYWLKEVAALPYVCGRTTALPQWKELDRPREKLLHHGRQYLSDAELLAILLGSGSRRETAVDLARRILHAADHDLHHLGQASISDLMEFHGVGQAKAITIVAALELGRRRQLLARPERPQITASVDAYHYLLPVFQDLTHEECHFLALNRANRVLRRVAVSSGGVSGTVVDAKVVFGRALQAKASGIILAHNHPSGQLRPSTQDRELTRKLVAAGKTLDLPLLDHLIITDGAYFSFADEGLLS